MERKYRGLAAWSLGLAAALLSTSALAQDKTVLTVYSTLQKEVLTPYENAFETAHPDIDITWIRDAGGVIHARLLAERDNLGRIIVDPDLRVPGCPRVFATGDTAKAATDNDGHFSLMSCQHARRLGAFAGHNAAADLLGEPVLPYDQPSYVVCLDLGPDTAIFTRGWSPRTPSAWTASSGC